MGQRIGLVASLVMVLAVSCGAPAPSLGQRVVPFDEDGLRVTLPAGWGEMRSSEVAYGTGRTLFYLSNRALHTDCVMDDAGQQCQPPVDLLGPGGLLLWWTTGRCAGTGCELPAGTPLLIGGREAVEATDTGACATIGANEEVVYAVTVTPQRVDSVVVCANQPSPAGWAELNSILATVDWRTP